MNLTNIYAFQIAYFRAILDTKNNCINNGYPKGSTEYYGYSSGLNNKGVIE